MLFYERSRCFEEMLFRQRCAMPFTGRQADTKPQCRSRMGRCGSPVIELVLSDPPALVLAVESGLRCCIALGVVRQLLGGEQPGATAPRSWCLAVETIS